MAGQPSIQQTQKFGQQAKNSRTRPYMWGSLAPGIDAADTIRMNSNAYPYKPLPEDPYDTEWNIRQEISTQDNGSWRMVTPARPLPWSEEEIDYLKRKRDAEEFAAYTDWIAKRFPINDPANRDLLKRIVPSYFSTRKANLREQLELTKKFAELRLIGPESEDDLHLQYLVETGRIKLPQGPLHDPMRWMISELPSNEKIETNKELMSAVARENKSKYYKGLFNPFRLLSVLNAPWAANERNFSDIVGDQRLPNLGPYGAAVPLDGNYYSQYRGTDELAEMRGTTAEGAALYKDNTSRVADANKISAGYPRMVNVVPAPRQPSVPE